MGGGCGECAAVVKLPPPPARPHHHHHHHHRPASSVADAGPHGHWGILEGEERMPGVTFRWCSGSYIDSV